PGAGTPNSAGADVPRVGTPPVGALLIAVLLLVSGTWAVIADLGYRFAPAEATRGELLGGSCALLAGHWLLKGSNRARQIVCFLVGAVFLLCLADIGWKLLARLDLPPMWQVLALFAGLGGVFLLLDTDGTKAWFQASSPKPIVWPWTVSIIVAAAMVAWGSVRREIVSRRAVRDLYAFSTTLWARDAVTREPLRQLTVHLPYDRDTALDAFCRLNVEYCSSGTRLALEARLDGFAPDPLTVRVTSDGHSPCALTISNGIPSEIVLDLEPLEKPRPAEE
ncbi:MAG: hypothetical protein KDM81_16455, partial [Verrucomicrobiae bacterium]|nr:hypothetical protein [Verrucomicrobiae bacterium]